MIEKVNITGLPAFDYLRTQLDMGISLSRCISKIPLESGDVYSFVPEGTAIEKLYKFNFGGIYPFDQEALKSTNLIPIQNESRPIILEEIKNHIDESDANCCIFENPNAAPYFPGIKASGIEFVHLDNEEVFFFFDKRNCMLSNLQNSFVASESYMFLCALSTLDLNIHSQFDSFNEIKTELLEVFTEGLSRFFVRAYDGEGYLMWVKR